MEDFFEKETYEEADIIQLIEDGIEESLNLEFKSADSLGKQDGKKKEIAKDVSALANSDGGIIIYGLREEAHVAREITFINGNEFSKEWLEQIINTNIQRRIKEVKILPIRFETNINQTIYLVKVPASNWAPHMCSKDNRYYRRFNFESVPMEEYEVRNLFNRKEKTELKIYKLQVKNSGMVKRGGKVRKRRYKLICSIINNSNSVEENYKIQLKLPSRIIDDAGNIHKYFDHSEDGINYYSVPGNAPIFQDEILTMFSVSLKFTRERIEQIEDEFSVNLLYSNGSEIKEMSVYKAMHDNGINPTDDFEMYA